MKAAAMLELKVAPGSARDEITGWLGDALKLRVRAAPEKGRANAAVVALLAQVLAVPKDRIVIVTGAGSRRKRVCVHGLSSSELRDRLEEAVGG